MEGGETLWQQMMQNRQPISEQEFLSAVDMSDMLDPDETPEQFLANSYGSDPQETAFYKSHWDHQGQIEDVMFLQTHGFEFIFRRDVKRPLL